MKRLDALHWSLIATLVVLLAYLLIGPYEYHRVGPDLVRMNRLTGEAEHLTGTGWREMKKGRFELDDKAE
jgi:hypothetical protein